MKARNHTSIPRENWSIIFRRIGFTRPLWGRLSYCRELLFNLRHNRLPSFQIYPKQACDVQQDDAGETGPQNRAWKLKPNANKQKEKHHRDRLNCDEGHP